MKITVKKIVMASTLALFLVGCTKAPITGRNQLIMLDSKQELALGYQSAKEVLQTQKISKDATKTAMMKRAGERIAKQTGRSDYLWEFFLIDNDKEANAFCLPGGKVFVYTGIFKYASNEDELASVMGHEIAHALARHGAERVSQSQLTAIGGQVLQSVMVGKGNPQNTALVMQAFGIGSQLGIALPFSREQEYEADHIGLILSAKAGYNPNAALTFWEKFAKDGSNGPEYLSTHPAGENRIAKLKSLMPSAMQYYKK